MNISEAAKQAAEKLVPREAAMIATQRAQQIIQSAIDTELASRDALIAAKDEALTGMVPGKRNSALQDIGQLAGTVMREAERPENPHTPRNDWFSALTHYAKIIEEEHLPNLRAALSPDTAARFVPVEEVERARQVRDAVILKHLEFGDNFQIGGRFYDIADLRLGADTVVEGGKWLIAQYDALTAERDELARKLAEAEKVVEGANVSLSRAILTRQELQARLASAEKDSARLRDAIEEYGEHQGVCPRKYSIEAQPCTCGLDDLLTIDAATK